MKGTKFFWGVLCAGVIGFTSCGTMQQRERGEQREFKCGTTTASSMTNRNLKTQKDTVETSNHDFNSHSQSQGVFGILPDSEKSTSNSLTHQNGAEVNTATKSNNSSSSSENTFASASSASTTTPLLAMSANKKRTLSSTRSLSSILPSKTEQKAIKEFVKSKFTPSSKNQQNRGIDAGDFLPVEGIISILAGLLGLIAGANIFGLIFGIIAVVFGIWGRFKRFNILAKIGFWMGVVVLAWWLLSVLFAGIF